MYQSCCINPVVLDFYDIRMFVSRIWCICIQKLGFFEILFLGVDPFVYFVYFPAKICLFATITPLIAIILMSSF